MLSRSAECLASAEHHGRLSDRLATSSDAAVPQDTRAAAARQPSLTVAFCLRAVALLESRRSRRARPLPLHVQPVPARLRRTGQSRPDMLGIMAQPASASSTTRHWRAIQQQPPHSQRLDVALQERAAPQHASKWQQHKRRTERASVQMLQARIRKPRVHWPVCDVVGKNSRASQRL